MAIKRTFIRTTLAACLFGGAIFSAQVSAEITWAWAAFNGEETGLFITDGLTVGGAADPGRYTVTDFSLTSSVRLPSLMGGSLLGGQFVSALNEFVWDGVGITGYFENTNASTNIRFDAAAPTGPYEVASLLFYQVNLQIADQVGTGPLYVSGTPTTVSVQASVPEPSSAFAPILAGLALAFAGRRRRRQVLHG